MTKIKQLEEEVAGTQKLLVMFIFVTILLFPLTVSLYIEFDDINFKLATVTRKQAELGSTLDQEIWERKELQVGPDFQDDRRELEILCRVCAEGTRGIKCKIN